MRGYFGIGIFHVKTESNIGTLWRSAYIYDAAFIFTIGRRYKKQTSDTVKGWRHIPLFHYLDYEDFNNHRPMDCPLICIEIADRAKPLNVFRHPERAIYLLGAEDHGLPASVMSGNQVVSIASRRCLNVSVAGSIVMYDRWVKSGEPQS